MKAIHVRRSSESGKYTASDNDGNRVIVPRDFALSGDLMYAKAALRLCEKMGWHGELVEGWLRVNERVFVWVNDSNGRTPILKVQRPEGQKGASDGRLLQDRARQPR
jgi:hypothetical protein